MNQSPVVPRIEDELARPVPARARQGRGNARLERISILLGPAIVFLVWLVPPQAAAQLSPLRAGQLPPIDQRTQAAILDSVCAVMDTMHVQRDVASETIAQWRKQFKKGAYRNLTDPVEYVEKLGADADAIYRNKHFGMAVLAPPDSSEPVGRTVDPSQTERAQRALRRQNYGFAKVEVLPGNIGYLRLDRFANTDQAAETAIGAMNFLGNSDAVIFDLRTNPGGDASMIRLLTTYLFGEQQHLIDWYVRDLEETIQSWTLDYVPGKRLAEVPVYVLTSDFTASAAEEFTFDLQHLKRATVVGDTTAGAGHTVNTVLIGFDNFRVGMRVPYGNAVDPKTGKGWEGTGVVPDIAVAEENALLAAQVDGLKRLRDMSKDPQDSLAVAWSLKDLDCRTHPVSLTGEALGEYVGTYGPRRIFVEGSELYYQREGRPRMVLYPMERDLFRVGDLNYFRLRFDRDATGKIVGVSGLYDDGREEPNPKTE